MAELHAATGAVTHLVIPSYRGVACVVHGDGSCAGRPPRPTLRELLPAHATAAGKVLLAFRQSWRDSVLASPLPRFTEATITSARDLERASAQIRVRGYAIDDGEYRPGTLGVAAPVFVRGQVPAALAIAGPRRAGVGDFVGALVERVVAAAARLTLALREGEPDCHGRFA